MTNPRIEVIDWQSEEQRRTWLSWALIAAIPADDADYWEKHKARVDAMPPDDARRGEMEVVFRVNGADVSIRNVVDRISEDFERQVKLKAGELVREKLDKLDALFCRLNQSLRNEFQIEEEAW